MACLREPCPSAWMLKCLCSAPRETIWPRPPVDGCKKEGINTSPHLAGHSRGYLQSLWPFYFTSSSPPPLCAIKETDIQTLIRWFIRGSSLPSSRPAGFLNKVVFLASIPCLRFIGLLCDEQSKLGLGNKTRKIFPWPFVPPPSPLVCIVHLH